MINYSRIFALAAAATLAVGSTTLATSPAGAATSIAVPIAGYDLDSTVGRSMVERRIAHAAALVCGPADARVLNLRAGYQACVADTIGNAIGQLGSVTVVASGASILVTASR